jgi:hypothetical protein
MYRSFRLAVVLPAAVAALLALTVGAGCSSGNGSSGSPRAAGRENANAAPADMMREIQCFRTHGMPAWPDPNYDPRDGRWHFDGPPLTAEARQGCAHLLPQPTPASPIPSSRLHDLLEYAKCMRGHGVPDWPDPTVAGSFVTNRDVKADPAVQAAATACEQYLRSFGGKIEIRPSDG